MSYVCSSLLACPTCGMGCNYNCTSSTPAVGDCICEETVAGNGACAGRENVPAITRGVPGMGSGTRGPRGQALSFRNFEGGGMTSGMDTKGIQSYILGLVSVGVLFFVIGYGYQAGKEKA